MPTVSIKYVFWKRAGRRRHGGTTTEPVPDDMLKSGRAKVLFWSLIGAAGGPIVSFTQAIPSFGVGTSDITATAVCVEGEPGPPRDEAYIDSFDIDTGTFFDDDFVSVYDTKNGPKNQALSLQANDYGLVPTSNDELVLANAPVPAGGFQYWKVIYNTAAHNGIELDTTPASKGEIAFAFYQKKKISTPPMELGALTPIIIGRFPGGIITLADGFIHFGGPCDPELTHILAAAQQYALSAQLSPTLRSKALDLTAKQLESVSKALIKSSDIREAKTKK